MPGRRPTSPSGSPKAIPSWRRSAASNATSRVRCTRSSRSGTGQSTRLALSLDKQKGIRGVRYAAGPYRAVLERHGIQPSMSRRGNCLDNAPMESFFAWLKTERVHEARFRTRAEARVVVFESIEVFYNCSSERTSRYVLEENRLCCAGSGTAGRVGRRFALRTSARTAELSRAHHPSEFLRPGSLMWLEGSASDLTEPWGWVGLKR